MTRRSLVPLLAALALAALWPSNSQADSSHSRPPAALAWSVWRPQWPTFSRAQGFTAERVGVGAGARLTLNPPRAPRWDGRSGYDDVRRPLKLEAAPARPRARAWGDLPYYTAPLLSLAVEPVLAAWAVRDHSQATLNLELVSLEALPQHPPRLQPASSERRTVPSPGAGFATTGATATGVPRVASDGSQNKNVLSDLGVGYAMPTLLHYSDDETIVSVTIQPGGPCTGACLKVAGSF